MAPTVTVSNEDIVAALGTSERFPAGSPQFEIFVPFIGHLVEIVGEDRLGEIVGFGALCDVASQFVVTTSRITPAAVPPMNLGI